MLQVTLMQKNWKLYSAATGASEIVHIALNDVDCFVRRIQKDAVVTISTSTDHNVSSLTV